MLKRQGACWRMIAFAIMVYLMGSNPALSAADELAAHLLEQLRRKDAMMQRGFYLSGIMHIRYMLPSLSLPGLDRDSSRFELASDPSRMAWQSRFLQLHGTPRYVPPHTEEAVNERYDYDKEGYMIFRIHAAEDEIYEPKILSAKRADVKVVSISPTGVMEISSGQSPVLFLYPDEWGDVTVEAARALQSTGRGYSYLIDTPITATRRSDGLLELWARGRDAKSIQNVPLSVFKGYFHSGASGTWVLVIDPAADYLVREARFYREGERKALSACYTEGVLQVGNLSIAAQGRWIIAPDREVPPCEYRFVFERFRSSFDDSFYQNVRKRIFDLPDGTSVMDYRHSEDGFISWRYFREKRSP